MESGTEFCAINDHDESPKQATCQPEFMVPPLFGPIAVVRTEVSGDSRWSKRRHCIGPVELEGES